MLKKLFNKISRKIYYTGKTAYENAVIAALYNKGDIDRSVIFSIGADIQNLQQEKNSIRIGAQSNIEGMIMVYPYGGKVTIGEFCSLSPGSRIISVENITIGNRVLIAHNVNIIDNNSHPLDAGLRHRDFKESFSTGMQQHDLKAAPILIEDDVWIGHNTTILKGVTIGKGAVIGASSVVTKNVEAWTVNVGNPLRCIRKGDADTAINP